MILPIIANKAHSYVKVMPEMNFGNRLDDAMIHIGRKHLNNCFKRSSRIYTKVELL
ncbi:hypothetical protein RLO149_p630210 (plasmid) [Roseobacter litoralis Och 149]|uniref:Uncharacterized protein n=1 Tax=Roseobacter litoralis (strain ATCC 49566 / DSM 6996 / JCM 21268 / NBRC 15278 / OCh 149) TaxID=391595 RepID=F7ZMK3_ROSLO|nr:hypothetical protein RLO149_p630210 [Roseobacter litoralis Och 149]